MKWARLVQLRWRKQSGADCAATLSSDSPSFAVLARTLHVIQERAVQEPMVQPKASVQEPAVNIQVRKPDPVKKKNSESLVTPSRAEEFAFLKEVLQNPKAWRPNGSVCIHIYILTHTHNKHTYTPQQKDWEHFILPECHKKTTSNEEEVVW